MLAEDAGKAGVFAQKTVAGMHGIGAGDLAGRHQRRNVEVGILGRRRPDADALVGHADVHGVAVGGRIDRDRRNAQFLAGAKHPQRDFATVGDEDLLKHQSMTASGWPYSIGAASVTRMREIVPDLWAGIWFMVFIASMMRMVWPSDTFEPTLTNAGLPGSGER